jgi:serine/threonine protein kinase
MDRSPQASTPRTIGRYQIVSLLTEGGRRSVYKARDPLRGVEVAIKLGDVVLTTDRGLRQRFEQDFRIASKLDHPNVVRVFELGWHDSRPYIVMEYVAGEDMWARIDRRGRIFPPEAVGCIIQVAQALHEAHRHGIIHRDIKPDHVLLTKDGQAKLAGLGLYRDVESESALTRPSREIKTPNFVAPEQFSDAKNVGVRCDVYSLAATLFMALTGQVPFAAVGLSAVLKKKVADDLISPRKLVPTLSARIDLAIRRALSADPEQRHASCLEFAAALTEETGVSDSSAAGTSSRPGKSARTIEVERRAAVRHDWSGPISCAINQSLHNDATTNQGQWDAQVRNLSANGLGLLLSRRFEPGSVLTVNFVSSTGAVKTTRHILVVRVTPAEGGVWFLAGKLTKGLSKEELRCLLEVEVPPRRAETASPRLAETHLTTVSMPATLSCGVPSFIGPYEVLETIGSGATATVYKGREPQTGAIVALKVSHGFIDLELLALERFKREFTAIGQLEHPHLVRALAMGEDRKMGITFVALEYVPGQNLDQHLKVKGPLTPEGAVPVFLQVAEGLCHLHANHFVHRDIKPSNILLGTAHQAKLADFGLLKDLKNDHRLTPARQAMGTMEFGAPEQFEDAKSVDRRCDLYSLAASLYTALTGKFPFGNGSQLQIMQRKVHNQFVPLRLLLPSLDPAIDRLVNRCLEPQPTQRPGDCDEIIAVLRDCMTRPVSVSPGSTESDLSTVKLEAGADRRASVRFAIDLTATLVPFHQRMRGRWDATILNVSATGVRLESPRAVAINSVLEVKLGGRTTAELVLVRWVQPGEGQKQIVGCSFVRPLPKQELEVICQAGTSRTAAG